MNYFYFYFLQKKLFYFILIFIFLKLTVATKKTTYTVYSNTYTTRIRIPATLFQLFWKEWHCEGSWG
jgi:hypothetical protein